MKIIISNRSSVPIYEQIKDQIISSIREGTLKANDKLPSIRKLAKELKISVITTTRAYSDLEEEGYIIGVQGKGYFILEQSKQLNEEVMMVSLETHLIEVIKLQNNMKISNSQLEEIYQVLRKELDNE